LEVEERRDPRGVEEEGRGGMEYESGLGEEGKKRGGRVSGRR